MNQYSSGKSQSYALAIIAMLFFIFGFITWLNSTLIPFLKLACELESDMQAFFVTTAFYMAYFFLAIPSAWILKKSGYKNGMALGLAVMALGSLVFIPAANDRSFPLFLIGLFVQGAGLALLQTASNPYASILGPIESAAKRISILGVCNKIAGILSPIILGAIVLKDAQAIEERVLTASDPLLKSELLNELTGRIVPPYIVIAICLFVLAFLTYRSGLPEISEPKEETGGTNASRSSVFAYPHLLLGTLCLFLYVGVEVLAGDAIGTYGKAMGMSLDETKYFTPFTLFAMLLGYIIGIFTIPKYMSQQTALKYSAILGILLTIGIYFSSGYTAIILIAALGLANALMWPAIFPLAIDGIGRFTQIGSAFLIMGIAGGAVVPPLYGWLKDTQGLSNQLSFFLCSAPAYCYILYYAAKGYRTGKTFA